ncbi:MAG: hypothetical protein H6822_36035 [Planctomycetaceae bacterium]|nr:hypothetical protein [Planctomycetales bacterium]MCB9927599.1 hypothetical protein [Planctomycetaceae bacterium]
MRNSFQVWLTYSLLLVLSVPWYWHWIPGANVTLFGMPRWAVSALVGSALVSCYTAWLLNAPWPGEQADGDRS